MPDESCRKCGGLLLEYSICAKCRAPIKFVCRICRVQTTERFHTQVCFEFDEIIQKQDVPRHATKHWACPNITK